MGFAAASAVAKMTDSAASEGVKSASNLLQRLLGPTADVIGADWADRLKQRNLERLLRKTEERAKGRSEPGYTSPRLAAATFEAAYYAEDEIVSEYLSGILTASRSADGGNDAGISWSSLVSRLSSDQLKLHYLIYSGARRMATRKSLTNSTEIHSREILLPVVDVVLGMGLPGPRKSRFWDALDGLEREGLILDGYAWGGEDFMRMNPGNRIKKEGFVLKLPFTPALRICLSIHGLRLFTWAMNRGTLDVGDYFDPDASFGLVDDRLTHQVPDPIRYVDAWRPISETGERLYDVEADTSPVTLPSAEVLAQLGDVNSDSRQATRPTQ